MIHDVHNVNKLSKLMLYGANSQVDESFMITNINYMDYFEININIKDYNFI